MSFCPLPWNHLATHPHGGVSLCCRVNYDFGEGMAFNVPSLNEGESMQGPSLPLENRTFLHLGADSVSNIMNSSSFRHARKEMLAGRWPKACEGCRKDEQLGLESKRLRELSKFKLNQEEAAKKTETDGRLKDVNFEYLELRLGNLCNLKCRTCNPVSSSKWIGEYSELQQKLSFIRKYDVQSVFDWPEQSMVWKDILDSSKDLKVLYINGGEPTLIKKHWEFLESLVQAGRSSQIEIKYNINMTQMPEKAQDLWKNFKHVFVGASVDDVYDRNAYIRHGADWNKVEENLLKLKAWKIPVAIEQTVSAINVWHLAEMESYTKKIGVGYGLNFVYDPEFLDIACLPLRVKESIVKKLKQEKLSPRWLEQVEAQLSVVKSSELYDSFKRYMEELDRSRGESFAVVYPEYFQLLNWEP